MIYAPRAAFPAFGLAVVMSLGLSIAATGSAQAQPGTGSAGAETGRKPAPQHAAAVMLAAATGDRESKLEVGALLCKSRGDLVRFQTLIAQGKTFPAATRAADCYPVPNRMSVEILDHDGPSRTEIVTTDAAKETGWTNSYLP